MAKQITIKQISERSGVSAGTVDRILHNRGRVSDEARAKVEAVLALEDYRHNLHTSAVSLKKGFVIANVCPRIIKGGYWSMVKSGIDRFMDEYSDIDIKILDYRYNQYDLDSCIEAYTMVSEQDCDAVIIGGTFDEKTRELCKKLDSKAIPYVFLDTRFTDCNEVGAYTADQYVCGAVMARLLDSMSPSGGSICVIRTARHGAVPSFNTEQRMKGLNDYFSNSGRTVKQYVTDFSSLTNNTEKFIEFLRSEGDINAVAVLNSNGCLIADALRRNGIRDKVLGSFDSTENNLRCLKEGSLSFILDQRPERQGFESMQRLISYLLYRKPCEDNGIIPLKIIIKEML